MPSKKKPVSPSQVGNQPKPVKKPTKKTSSHGPPLIVGIGASAGGLEALEQFFGSAPPTSGMAFVVVQHLDPTHQTILPELLQRSTAMNVVEVTDRTEVRANQVYVVPPNKDMSILHGVLHLMDPATTRGPGLPIDFFFRTLAEDQREKSVGIILSGMGTDGTLGIRAIKEQAGLVMVQDPATAKFGGMPRSAIDAGLADIVAPADQLPASLVQYQQHTPLLTGSDAAWDDNAQSQLEKVVILLRSRTGHDFSLYKPNTLYRRIERRMGLHQIAKIAAYVRYLRQNPQEADLLFKELLIGVTSFFRDPEVWDKLRDKVLPALFASRATGQGFRAWVPGCSTGEEAYSLAIVFREALARSKPRASFSLQIFATDLDHDGVERARLGRFPANIAADVSPERLDRFFIRDEHGYRVSKEIREMVIFAQQNLVMDPPFTKLDLLTCRNLLIYFTPELQKKLLPLFHYSLNPGGTLLLGSAESASGFTDLFTPLDSKARLFSRKENVPRPELVEFPSAFAHSPLQRLPAARATTMPPENLQTQAERWLLRHHAPAAVLVNNQGDILFISGSTGSYLEPAAGKANWNVFVMAREELRYELSDALQRAVRDQDRVTVHRLKSGSNGGEHHVDLSVQFLKAPEPLRGLVMIVFKKVETSPGAAKGRPSRPASGAGRIRELELELREAKEDVQSTREEMQTSQEELKSMNEELQSTNEELQSTNEELTTSKEEMQSLNEELQTLNAELQAKVDELSTASNDMRNLLNSTEIATVFLDDGLRVRRFTEQAAKIIHFIPGDVGRPITDLASELLYAGLAEDASEVLRNLQPIEKALTTQSGRRFAMRLMPYRTMDNRIDGVVITFTDMTSTRKLETETHTQQGTAE